MNIETYHTYREIKSQTEAWKQALHAWDDADVLDPAYEQVIFTGCGSTYYLSLTAAALYQEFTGEVAQAVPASELLFNPQTVVRRNIFGPLSRLLVAISRSGTTTETLRAVEQFKENDLGKVAVISNYEGALSRMGDSGVVIDQGQEESIAQTRSFASMLVAATRFTLDMGIRGDVYPEMRTWPEGDGWDQLSSGMERLPGVGQRIMESYEPLAREIGENLDFDRFYFLGSGIRYGLACEANLKMKEMTLTHSEPFHFLEFRHGPMSMVNDRTVVIGLLSEKNYRYEQAVLNEMQAKGGKILSLGESNADVCFESSLPESVRAVLYLPVLQLMAFYRSVAKGLDPDRPHNLTAVVKLDL